MHPLRLISQTLSELDRGCCGRAADPPVFILVGRLESRSKVLAVIAMTYELGPPDITETPEERAAAACGMLSEEVKGQGCCRTCAQMSRNRLAEFSLT